MGSHRDRQIVGALGGRLRHQGARGTAMTRSQKPKSSHIGTSFDAFVKSEGMLEDNRETAIKRLLASQLQQAMKASKLTKVEMARRMRTSRVQLDRLLDPDNDSVTLATLRRAAAVVGREVRLELVRGDTRKVSP
jgi:antitoxin HicB